MNLRGEDQDLALGQESRPPRYDAPLARHLGFEVFQVVAGGNHVGMRRPIEKLAKIRCIAEFGHRAASIVDGAGIAILVAGNLRLGRAFAADFLHQRP